MIDTGGGGEHQDVCGRGDLLAAADRRKGVAGHVEVDEDDVGMLFRKQINIRRAPPRPDHRKSRNLRKYMRKPTKKDRMIIYKCYGDSTHNQAPSRLMVT